MRLLSSIALLLGLVPAAANAQDRCADLWYERNDVYKQAGYCFKTAQAIRVFGNAGCMFDDQRDVPLSARDRARINEIVRLERALRCPR